MTRYIDENGFLCDDKNIFSNSEQNHAPSELPSVFSKNVYRIRNDSKSGYKDKNGRWKNWRGQDQYNRNNAISQYVSEKFSTNNVEIRTIQEIITKNEKSTDDKVIYEVGDWFSNDGKYFSKLSEDGKYIISYVDGKLYKSENDYNDPTTPSEEALQNLLAEINNDKWGSISQEDFEHEINADGIFAFSDPLSYMEHLDDELSSGIITEEIFNEEINRLSSLSNKEDDD